MRFSSITAALLLGGTAMIHAAVDPAASTTRFVLVDGLPPVLESDVLKNDTETPVIAPVDYFREKDDFLIKATAALSGKEAWVKVVHEWAEPITAPDGTVPAVRSDLMILVELKGKVTIASGKTETPAETGQILPPGVTVSTGAESSVAIFIGGLNSVRLGPNTKAAVEYQVIGPFRGPPGTPMIQRRTTRVRLDGNTGKAFCKLGYDPQVTQYFDIRCAGGMAVAAAGDFIVIHGKDRFEVGVARGTVRVLDAKGKEATTLTSGPSTGLLLVRIPEVKGQLAMMTANSQFLESTLQFITLINHRVNKLLERYEHGEPLSESEKAYLEKIPTISYLRKARRP